MHKKIIVVFLALALVFTTLAACGSGSGGAATTAAATTAAATTAAATTAAATTAAAATTTAAAGAATTTAALTAPPTTTAAIAAPTTAAADTVEPPLQVTWFRSQINRNAITYWKDALWLQELQARMNIEIDFNGPLSGHGSADYNTAINVLLNSGDLPDMMYHNWNTYSGGIQGTIEDGIAVDVKNNADYWAHLPHFEAIINSNDLIRKAVTLDNGGVACFNQVEESGNRAAYNNLCLREDWLDLIGKEPPTTVDELYEIFVALKEAMPNVYPMTDEQGLGTLQTLMPAWGMRYNTPYPDPDTGLITYWTLFRDGDAFTDFVTTMNKWYSEGLIDPDFPSNDGAAREAKVTGQISTYTLMMPQQLPQWRDAIVAANPELEGKVHFYGLQPLTGYAGEPYSRDSRKSMAASGSGTIVTTAAEKAGKVERILDMIDYLFSPEGTELNSWGVEGISYYVDSNGTKQWSELVTDDPQFSFGDAVFKYAIPTFGDWPKIMSYEAWLSQETADPDSYRAHENLLKGNPDLSAPGIQLRPDESEEYNRIRGDANTMIEEYFVQLIIGVRPLSDIPVLLAELDRIGLRRAMDIYQVAYDRFNEK
ncbi:MAG: hypothetical protein FWH01_12540 [Oscillospiraceae bacterium]|nr:hypothetical protein [Oscillospiraceae bacterium]